jgi:hypothetical protein
MIPHEILDNNWQTKAIHAFLQQRVEIEKRDVGIATRTTLLCRTRASEAKDRGFDPRRMHSP